MPSVHTSEQQTDQLTDELLAAFRHEIQPVDVSWSYRVGILLAAVVMILLPVVYLGVIGLILYALFYHAVHNLAVLQHNDSDAVAVTILLYFVPFVCGVLLILFMIKPLFARAPKTAEKQTLCRADEPALFAVVDRLCECVHAPKPNHIDVDCEINASASFRGGVFGMFSDDLVLTIGLPLVAGLSLRQLAGVLAHEFGHFSQRTGMRLTFVIRSVSFWFTRVVYERDAWDEWLWRASQRWDMRVGVFLYLARFVVWLTRRVLWLLMMIGHIVAGFMLRQMEFDADRHETRLAGSDAFAETSLQLTVLNVAFQAAQQDMSDFYRDGRLADHLPKLIMHTSGQLSDDIMNKIHEHIRTAKTGLLDTHPCDRDRITHAKRENTDGVFHSERTATDLFCNFDVLARKVTIKYYRNLFGDEFKPELMHPIDDILVRQTREHEANLALERFYQGAFHVLRPLEVRYFEGNDATTEALQQKLVAARQKILDTRDAYRVQLEKYCDEDGRAIEARQAAALLRCNFQLKSSGFSVPVNSLAAAMRSIDSSQGMMDGMGRRMLAFETAVLERFTAAFSLLKDPAVRANVADGEAAWQELDRLVAIFRQLRRSNVRLLSLRDEHLGFIVLCNQLSEHGNNPQLVNTVLEMVTTTNKSLQKLKQDFTDYPYPFDHAEGAITVADFLVPELPTEKDDVKGTYQAGETLVDRFPSLQARLTARLALIAESVESACNLPLFAVPAYED